MKFFNYAMKYLWYTFWLELGFLVQLVLFIPMAILVGLLLWIWEIVVSVKTVKEGYDFSLFCLTNYRIEMEQKRHDYIEKHTKQ